MTRLNVDYKDLDDLIAELQERLPAGEKLTRCDVKLFESIFFALAEICEEKAKDQHDEAPLLLTLDELREIGPVWKRNTPPFLWIEIDKPNKEKYGYWISWCDIGDILNGCYKHYSADNYGKFWRCWTAEPTDEQREAAPWES